ncbi:DUF2254 domain-containing protein [Alteromonas sp. ASW11-130]|uniref:DUF2254 domain-containing protein n=1 Tax=Alteromonas sp. ASW11-130 TaxID=3015775 RepID=UPI002242A7C9|nr:DUF2254 domain-containing protein [Alteromonas sp. ASW11-130]MCW8091222.1 DUF2254 domain-containing protein [Alteromonas sp. ASW11-130]
MTSFVSLDRLRFWCNRLGEQLWVRPLAVCLISVTVVFTAKIIDGSDYAILAPEVAQDSVENLLSLLAASMLVIATFSVASMVSAYAAASSSATPRSFTLVLADDVSQNALSTFVGAFIFSVVALTAVKNAFYGKAGLFVLFILTIIVFAMVIVTFVRWVDTIARLGRIGSTIEKVERATEIALKRRQDKPTLGGISISSSPRPGTAVYASKIGYVQHIDMATIQRWAEDVDAQVVISALPGAFASPNQALAYVSISSEALHKAGSDSLINSFRIGRDRTFEDDPRFGLIALSEIAARALSPAVNDPGTAIKVIGTLVRLITSFNEQAQAENQNEVEYDRVAVPKIAIPDMFDDAFMPIARDGAGAVEVGVRLQKALSALESLNNDEIRKAASYHKVLALKRASKVLDVEEDLVAVKDAAHNVRPSIKQLKNKT